ncbi:hypothetical protein MHBO_003660 [Bonamia ostreae]|uniref:Transmembrane protein n=1 Tax=Bonamia ostreae TaxID=126728 RepID=A0ABV2AR49_9EUKA
MPHKNSINFFANLLLGLNILAWSFFIAYFQELAVVAPYTNNGVLISANVGLYKQDNFEINFNVTQKIDFFEKPELICYTEHCSDNLQTFQIVLYVGFGIIILLGVLNLYLVVANFMSIFNVKISNILNFIIYALAIVLGICVPIYLKFFWRKYYPFPKNTMEFGIFFYIPISFAPIEVVSLLVYLFAIKNDGESEKSETKQQSSYYSSDYSPSSADND